MQSYRLMLDHSLSDLARYPMIGRSRDDLFPGCRTRAVGQHIIFYHVTDTEIVVVRLVHRRENIGTKLTR